VAGRHTHDDTPGFAIVGRTETRKKSHGGAVLTQSSVKEATYHNRKLARIEEKRQIAKTALTFIKSSMSIFMDAGTTTYELAALMVRKHWDDVTIITNELAIAQLLTDVPGIHVIMVRGTVDAESASTCGTFASKAIKELYFDICFIRTQAIDPDFRLMSANAAKVDVKLVGVEAAAQTVLLVDHSKFHKYKLYEKSRCPSCRATAFSASIECSIKRTIRVRRGEHICFPNPLYGISTQDRRNSAHASDKLSCRHRI
jgi:DeoR/GlpR family transcriptional regulator of sugar metabolism